MEWIFAWENGNIDLIDDLNLENVDDFAVVDVIELVKDEYDVVQDDKR